MNSCSCSVVMATYHGERHLRAQLLSLAAQQRLPDELLVCDDGSTDATLEIAEAFQREAPFPVRIYRNAKRLGFADNFLHGVTRTRGEVIAFCDQDDLWHPEKLARCVNAFRQAEVVLAVHSAEVVDDDLKPLGFRKPDNRQASIREPCGGELDFSTPGFAMVVAGGLMRAFATTERPNLFEAESSRAMPHDSWTYFLACVAGRIAFVPEVLASYRQHQSNTCGVIPPRHQPLSARDKDGASYLHRAEASAYYATYLRQLAIYPEWNAKLQRGAADYEQQAHRYRLRAAIYTKEKPRTDRLRALVSLYGSGFYQTPKSLMKDVIGLVS